MPIAVLSAFDSLATIQWPPSFSEFAGGAVLQSQSTSVVSIHNGSAALQNFVNIHGPLHDDGVTIPLTAIIDDVSISVTWAMTTTGHGLLTLVPLFGSAAVGDFGGGGGGAGSGVIAGSLGPMSRADLFADGLQLSPYIWKVLVQTGAGDIPWTATVNITAYTVTVTYHMPFSVVSIAPVIGPATGGTPCVVTGTGFVNGATVTFDGIPGVVTFVSATELDVVTPPHALGAVDVVVTNPDTTSGTLSSGFTYVPGQWQLYRFDLKARPEQTA